MMRNAIVAATALFLATLSSACSTLPPAPTSESACTSGNQQAGCPRSTAGNGKDAAQHAAADDAQHQREAIRAQFRAATEQCKRELESATDLDPIRAKVELYRDDWDLAPPFAIAVLDAFPDDTERNAIAKFATLRDACIRRSDAISTVPPGASPSRRAFLMQDRAYFKEAYARVGELIVALYQQKLTYAEFAQKRYEVTRDANAVERLFRQAAALNDERRRVEAQRMMQKQAMIEQNAWTAYVHALDARTPHAVYLYPH